MEEVKDECPTEILVELKEDSFVPSHVNQNLLDHKSDARLKNEEHLAFERKSEDYRSIMDMSPFRIKEKFGLANISNIVFEAKQDLRMDLNIDDCATGILVDLPNNLNSPSKACTFLYNTPCAKIESKMCHLQNSVIKTTDSEKEVCLRSGIKNCRLSGDTDNDCCSESNEGENKSLPSKSGFKTPSPQSMSLISSEASKVINYLNSLVAFDEDDLLDEEMLPIPLNFDDFDDISDREKQLSEVTDACENKIEDHKISTSVQIQCSSNNSDVNIVRDTIFRPDGNENLKVFFNSEDCLSPLSSEAGCSSVFSCNTQKNTSDEHSKEYISCEMKSDSLDTSNFSASANSTDVFIMSHIADEDKENSQRNEMALHKKNLKSCKTLQKKSFISEKKESRETLKNLSNINPKSTNKDSALKLSQNSYNKQKAAPQMKRNINSKTKMFQPPSDEKLQLKKTVSAVESRIPSKRMSLSNSFHFQRSSFATPSKRYSISTPLKGAALKPQFTPLLPGCQSRALPRFTPQSVGQSRLSFSKSLQPSSKNSDFSVKQQCSTASSSAKLSQPSLARFNSTKPDKSFGQNTFASNSKILGKTALSTSNTKRFGSKLSLPSPFSAAQDKHLARILFPSDP